MASFVRYVVQLEPLKLLVLQVKHTSSHLCLWSMAFCAMFSPTLNVAISSTTYCCYRIIKPSSTTSRVVTVRASSTEESETNDKDTPAAFNPFGFVTDNPSSRGAIQLPENPAEDGNVGQMLYVIILSFCFLLRIVLYIYV